MASLAEWQQRLDTEFPSGAQVCFEWPEQDGTAVFPAAYLGIVGEDEDGFPVLFFQVVGMDKAFEFSLKGYKQISKKPHIVHATTSDGSVWFSNAISDEMAQNWSQQREADKAEVKLALEYS